MSARESNLSVGVAAENERVLPAHSATLAPVFMVLGGVSFAHFLNDVLQSLIPSMYPILKENYALSFVQIGLITLTFQITASLLQPLVGMVTDRRPMPYSLAMGMGSTFVGLLLLGVARTYGLILIAAGLVGLGSSVFHPESSRVARQASGGQFGLAQSLFQVGGNFGNALGPILAALIVVPFGQRSLAWFSIVAAATIFLLWRIGRWSAAHLAARMSGAARHARAGPSSRRTVWALVILVLLVFSKFIYMASLTSYYTFFLMHKFGVSTQTAQVFLFLFLAATAVGTFFGGPIGDRFGRRYVIWFSILGVLPFTLGLVVANLVWTAVLSILIGLILSSAMPAIIVYAQELMPHRFGMVSGLFFGFAFGAGGVGAALLGLAADQVGIEFVYRVCAVLPALGLFAVFLPVLPRGARM